VRTEVDVVDRQMGRPRRVHSRSLPNGPVAGLLQSRTILDAMATYEYLCLSCERPFEQQRSMTASVDTALACPACGSDRVRRRFSFVAPTSGDVGSGCACGGACACGR
jgi:putative FmdB family regulatory protein